MMEQEKLTELLLEYIDKKLSAERMEEISHWMEEDEEVRLHYQQLLGMIQKMDGHLPEVPSERMEARFEQWLETQQSLSHLKTRNLASWYRIAAGVTLLIIGGVVALSIVSMNRQKKELARIQIELERTKQLVLSELNNLQSASQRISAVYSSQEIVQPDAEIMNLLIKTMNEDPNSNVRMVALDALSKYYHQAEVRSALIQSMKHQKDPVVQIALIQLLVQMKEKVIIEDLEKMTHEPGLFKAVKDEAYKGIFKLT